MLLHNKNDQPDDRFGKIIDLNTERKLRARREAGANIPTWIGMMGLVAWAVLLPAVIGVLVGSWLDKRWPGPFSWTLTLMLVGVAIGCFAAWRRGQRR